MYFWIKKCFTILSIFLMTGCSISITKEKFLTNKYSDNVIYKKSYFFELKNWNKNDQIKSYNTFKKSALIMHLRNRQLNLKVFAKYVSYSLSPIPFSF